VSLHYYPHEDLQIKPRVRPEGLEPGASDYVPIAIINLTLAMAFVSFAINGGVVGSLVALGLIAGFNVLALRGMSWRGRGRDLSSETEYEHHIH
jgi:hypothetical protein